ncbi:hypothetical protein DSECCO2_604670 [anaerobic digester metagenome]
MLTTRPGARAGAAAIPLTSTFASDLRLPVIPSTWDVPIVVIGRDWRMKSSLPTIAHSTSCGTP